MSVADTGYPTQIVPEVALFATQPTSSSSVGTGPQGGGEPAAGGNDTAANPAHRGRATGHELSVQAPVTLSVSTARQGIKVTVTNVPQGKLVAATLRFGARVVAQAVRRARRNGPVTLVLKPHRANAALLHEGAQLRITVTAAGTKVARTIQLRTGYASVGSASVIRHALRGLFAVRCSAPKCFRLRR